MKTTLNFQYGVAKSELDAVLRASTRKPITKKCIYDYAHRMFKAELDAEKKNKAKGWYKRRLDKQEDHE